MMRPPRAQFKRSRRRLAAAITLAFALWQTPALAAEPPLGASLDGLIAHARAHNPELAASRLEAAAARERVEPAAALPDPRFELELMDFTNTMNPGRSASLIPGEVGATRYRIVQMLPFAGKRELRGQVAQALADRSDSVSAAARLKVEGAIKTAYARHYQASGQVRILRETIALVEGLEQIVLTRYGLGLVPQQDAIQVQGELTSLKIDVAEAERRRIDAVAKLNALLPRAPDAPLAEPAVLPPLPPALTLAALIEDAAAHSPEFGREQAALTAAEHSRALTYRDRYPDFGVALANNRPRGGRDSWDLMIELNIPLQQASRRAREREAERRVEAAEAQRNATAARLSGRIGELTAAIDTRRDQARLLRDTLLPQAEANLDAAQAGYESGNVNFNTLIEAERRILRTRLALLDAEVEARAGLAELEQLVGAPL
ncbi:MAG TPA: TolC family protein [Rhodocyclaceae bacterium]|nr:TolC family protein [Rhodocyclaceae bacterium]